MAAILFISSSQSIFMPASQSTSINTADLYTNHIVKGAIFLIIGEALLVVMAAIIKHTANDLPNPTIVFFRNLFGLLFLLPFLFHFGVNNLKTNHLHLHLIRAISGITAMYGFFYVIAHIPLAEASLMKLMTPFFLPIIAYLWLKEEINKHNWWAIIIGFIGVIFILRPGADSFTWIAVIGIIAAALASVAKTSIRRMALTEPPVRVVFYFAILATLISGLIYLYIGNTPNLEHILWLALTGLCGTLGQILLTKAYQIAKPGQIGPYTYSSVLFASLFGWLFWGEWLLFTTIIGSILITIAGLINLRGKK